MKKILLYLLTSITIFTFTACGKSKETNNTAAENAPKKTITIGVLPDTDSVPFVIADKNLRVDFFPNKHR